MPRPGHTLGWQGHRCMVETHTSGPHTEQILRALGPIAAPKRQLPMEVEGQIPAIQPLAV